MNPESFPVEKYKDKGKQYYRKEDHFRPKRVKERLDFDQFRLRRESDLQNRPPPPPPSSQWSGGHGVHFNRKLLCLPSKPLLWTTTSLPRFPNPCDRKSEGRGKLKYQRFSTKSSVSVFEDQSKEELEQLSSPVGTCRTAGSRINDRVDTLKVKSTTKNLWADLRPKTSENLNNTTVETTKEKCQWLSRRISLSSISSCDDEISELPSYTASTTVQDETEMNRHGRVQSVKLLSEDNSPSTYSSSNGGNGVRSSLINGQSATVSFIDIRSASKALRAGPTLSGQSLQIAYYEPGSVPNNVESNASPSVSGDLVVTNNSEISLGSSNNTTTSSNNTNLPIPIPPTNPPLTQANTPTTNGPGTNSNTNSYRQQRFPIQHGQSDDGSSHFYEQPKGFSRGGRGDDHFHGGRERRENRYLNNNRQGFKPDRERRFRSNWYANNENRFAPPPSNHCEEGAENERTMSLSIPPVTINNNEPGTNKSLRIPPPLPPDSPANSVSSRHLPTKIHQSRSVSESGSSDRGSSVGSRSRSGSRSSLSTSPSSGRSRSPPPPPPSQHHGTTTSGQVSSGGGPGGSSGGRFHQNSSFSSSHHQRYNRSRLVSRPADSSRIRHSHSSRSPPMGGRSRSSSSSSSPSPHRKVSTAPHSRSRSPSSTKSYSPSRSLNSSSSHHPNHQNQSKSFRAPNSSECPSSIRIRNLPSRSSDTSLKDGLYHEYKKHGKVSWVRINGNGPERYAVVCFKSPDHSSRAVQLSQDKLFFGCKIQVTPYQPYQGRGSGGEEGFGTEDDNRPFGDDEFATTTPSRTVFVTGLDPSITAAEMRKTFEQYGDIVDAKVRKPVMDMATCSGIIEFVDIASANRAQWVRHAFKARETRISFYRNPVSSSILLDGITGVTEKQITGHCCQFGAISRIVIDSERILALVQFEEISSAQTALRELKNWIQKGKQLHVDYASPSCVRLFLDRTMATTGNSLRLSPDLRNDTATPPFHSAYSGTPIKNRRSGSRKFSDLPNDRRTPYTEGGLDEKPGSDLEGLCSRNVTGHDPIHLENCNGRRSSRYNGMDEEIAGGDPEENRVNGLTMNSMGDRRSSKPKHNMPSTKIDLSCHETDSAVVTSSSDIICVESENIEVEAIPYDDHPHNKHIGGTSTLITVNGDDHGTTRCYESVGVLKSRATSYRWSSKSQSVFDGVSSTSPEPKTETVREKVSPDSGIGNGSSSLVMTEPFPPPITMEIQVSPVLLDPRRKVLENKIRRSSADSGNNVHCSAFVVVNSNSSTSANTSSITPSDVVVPDKNNAEDLEDRPSTPLCDENRDTLLDKPTNTKSLTRKSLPPTKPSDPPTKELPGMRQNYRYKTASSPTLTMDKSESPMTSQSPVDQMPTIEASPVTVPPPPPQSVMPSSVGVASNVEDSDSVLLKSEEKSLSSFSSSPLPPPPPPPPAKSTNVDNTNGPIPIGYNSPVAETPLPQIDSLTASSSLKKVTAENDPNSRKVNTGGQLKIDEDENHDDVLVSPPSSDCDESPRRGEDDLTQRLQELYQKFDAWDSGSRSIARSSSYAPANTDEGTDVGNCSRLTLHLDKPWLSRSKAIDLDELRQQPSDITKSLIGKRSVFDDDSQRLESLNNTNLSTSLSDWRASFSGRSNSMASNPSTSASTPLTPGSASSTGSSMVFPPLTPITTRQLSNLPGTQEVGILPTVSKASMVPSSIPVKIPITSAYVPTAGPLPNSIIKRKEAATVATPWTSKDPRLASKSSFPLPTQSTATPILPHRSLSLSALLTTKPSEISKSKVSSDQSSTIDEHSLHKPPLMTQKSAPPTIGVHHGNSRMMERSMSLDNKKVGQLQPSSIAVPGQLTPLSPPPPLPIPVVANPCNSIPALTNNTIVNSVRKISLENYSSKDGGGQNAFVPSRKEGEVKPKLNKDQRDHNMKESKTVSTVTIIPSPININAPPTLVSDAGKTVMSKDESRVNVQTPVAVVVQAIPVLNDRTKPSGNSSGKVKECNKKEKDSIKKSSRSGSSSGSGICLSKSKEESTTISNKSSKEKVKRDKNGEKLKHEHDNSRHHHHIHKEKVKEKETTSVVTKEKTTNEILYNVPTMTIIPAPIPQELKKEKELKQAAKRRLSVTELEQDFKKQKIEKESKDDEKEKESCSFPQQLETSHSRTKSVSSSGSVERRESSLTKEKKEKSHSTSSVKSSENNKGETSSSPLPPPSKDKSGGKSHSKDSHHRTKSTSSTSSSRNHYHGKGDKEKTTSSSSSLHSHQNRDKDKQKDSEKVSSPKEKENSKPSSQNKHSSSSSHTHHRKNEKEEKSYSSSSKNKSKEKGRVNLTLDSDDDEGIVGGVGQKYRNDKSKQSNSSGKSDKKDSVSSTSGKTKRDRQKSGGDSSSAPCDSLKGDTSRGKIKEQKKRRSRVVEETDSSSDDEDRGKHHSIFDVVVDEYVSMYDKVKARSNRACKNVARKQEEEMQKRQDKIQDSLQLLKKSRARRDEKKRFSIDERLSTQNSSDDDIDSRHQRDSSHDFETDQRQRNHSPVTQRGSLSMLTGLCTSSDDEDKIDTIVKYKNPKPKSKSSRDGSIKSEKSKSSRKSSKASPLRSSAYFLNHSDEDSGPSLKKRKMSLSKHKTSSIVVDMNKSSDEDSLSEPIHPVTTKRPSLKKAAFVKPERKSLVDIYTESDNSLQSFKELKPAPQLSTTKSRKDKNKQKSIRHIFETSDSSADEKVIEKPKKVKTSTPSFSTMKVSRSKKKLSHHGHTHGRSGSKSKRKRERLNSDDGKNVVGSDSGRKNQPSMEDLLFGPMSNSGSEFEEREIPKSLPSPVEEPLKSKQIVEDTSGSVSSFRKSKSVRSRSKQRKSSSVKDSSSKSVDENSTIENSNSTRQHSSHSELSSEKRKKKHHKKSKRTETGREATTYRGNEQPLDIDSLFSTPASSPVVVTKEEECPPVVTLDDSPKITLFAAPLPAEVSIQVHSIPNCSSSPAPQVIDEEKLGSRSMFSSDEEDDDKLKIDISEAIISASGGNEDDDDLPMKQEPEVLLGSSTLGIDEAAAAAATLLEEEEKKRNSMVEQDKAIESILMERKSPPRTPSVVLGQLGGLGQLQPQRDLELDYIKDECKDEASISQEETEDAVAALLKNLGNDDLLEEDTLALEKRTASPPTIRILEGTVMSPLLSFSDSQVAGSENEMVTGRSSWFQSQTKSEVEVQVPFQNESSLVNDSSRSPPRKKKLTCEEASLQLHKVLEMAKQAVADSKKMEEETAQNKIQLPGTELVNEKPVGSDPGQNENESGISEVPGNDVYEFHDSDDESTRTKAVPVSASSLPVTAPLPPPPPPLPLPPVFVPKEPKAVTPPRIKSPASSGLLELVIEKLPLVQPTATAQFSPKTRPPLPPPPPFSLHSIPVQQPVSMNPIVIDVQTPPEVFPVRPLVKPFESPAVVVPVPIVPTTPHVPLLTTNRTTPPTIPPPSAAPRNSVDETIEDVIKNFKCVEVPYTDTTPTLPLSNTTGRKGKRRSGSKDSDEIAVIAAVAAGKVRQPSPTRRLPTTHQSKVQKIPIETRTDIHVSTIPESFLIDPQTGHLTHKTAAGQAEEAQFVNSGQDPGKLHFLHAPPPSQQNRIGQKPELERAGSLERIPPEHQPYQIQMQKNEGLPAILAQQQQHHLLHQQVSDLPNCRQSPSAPQRKDSFGTTRTSPPVSSPSFNFGPLRVPTPQSPPTSMPGRLYAMYPNPPSQPGYTPLMRPQQQDLRGALPPNRHQMPVGQHVPSPGQIQAQLVRIPQVPMATTITKVDTRTDEIQNRKSSLTQPPSTVILTTTSNGSMEVMAGMRHPGPHHLPARVHESYSSQGPPRIEIISGGIVQSAHSPKGSRVPQQEHRIHHIAYETPMDDPTSPVPLDLAPSSAHNHSRANNNNNNPVTKNLPRTNSNSVSSPSPPSSSQHHLSRQTDARGIARVPGGLEGQFLGSMALQGNPYLPYNHPNVPPGQLGFGVRPGSVDPLKQTTEAPKQLDRPSTAHLVPQHLSSPHLGERGSAESPHLVPMYASRHPIYGNNGHLTHSPIPSAHQHQRQTFTHPFEFDESRMYARSPGYQLPIHHETREREGREDSPFPVTAVPLRARPEETPPPAHGMVRYSQHQVLPENSPSAIDRQRLLQEESPSHGPLIPGQGDSLLMLLQRYPIVWQGLLGLKNDSAACQFHFVSGNMNVATDSLPTNPDGTTLPLRISQRMRLETVQLDGVARKLQTEQEHCMLLALPCGRDHLDVLQHSNNLRAGFITYLQVKQAAGIVNIPQSNGDTPSFVIHIFPACEFADENLARIAPDLLQGVTDIAHLLIVIATV